MWARRSESDPTEGLRAGLPGCPAPRLAEKDASGGPSVIRHKVSVEGRSNRQVAKELGISRVTVRKYVEESAPVRKETGPRARPV
jgi:hypothetical protein